MEIVLEAGAEDMVSGEKTCEVTCPPGSFLAVSAALAQKDIVPELSEISMIAQTTTSLNIGKLRKALALLEELEDHDDVQNVYSDLDIPEEVMTQLTEESP